MRRATGILLGAVTIVLLASRSAPAVADCCPPHTSTGSGTEVVQEFPASGPMETAWRVRFGHAQSKGLFITGAWFKRAPGEPWMRVLWDARVADIFVPYHSGSPRYYDLTGFNFDLVPATAADAGCCGTVLDGVVVKEVRDRGVLWKNDLTLLAYSLPKK